MSPVLRPRTFAHAVDTQQPIFNKPRENKMFTGSIMSQAVVKIFVTQNVDVPSVCVAIANVVVYLSLSVCMSNAGIVSKLKRAVRLRIIEIFSHPVGPSFYF